MLTIFFNLAEGQVSIVWSSESFQLIISTGFAAKLGQASVRPFCSGKSVPVSPKNVWCFSVFREAVGASASYRPHRSHIPNILRLLIWHFQADDSYTRPTQHWLQWNSLKGAHKRAIWQSRRKALQISMSVQVISKENRADPASYRSVNNPPQLQR